MPFRLQVLCLHLHTQLLRLDRESERERSWRWREVKMASSAVNGGSHPPTQITYLPTIDESIAQPAFILAISAVALAIRMRILHNVQGDFWA